MTPDEIKLELFRRRKRVSMSGIAKSLGVSRQAVSAVIDRKFVSDRIMRAVAKAIDRDVRYVFPQHYRKGAQ